MLKYKIPQIVTLIRIYLGKIPQIVTLTPFIYCRFSGTKTEHTRLNLLKVKPCMSE